MKRRDFIALLGGAAAVCPIAARAQQTGQIHRIGFLGPAPDNPLFVRSYPEFLAELRKLGFTEGGNLIVENRRIDEGAPKAFAAAAEVIRSKVDVVVTFGPELALKAAFAASQTIPIVMIAVNFDPIAGGYCEQHHPARQKHHGAGLSCARIGRKTARTADGGVPERETNRRTMGIGLGRAIRVRPTHRAIPTHRAAFT